MAISSGEYWPYLLLFPECLIQAHILKKKKKNTHFQRLHKSI